MTLTFLDLLAMAAMIYFAVMLGMKIKNNDKSNDKNSTFD